ncbi:MAG TPA: FecR family protein [Pyrinomonadaceae bacterium]|nr:FecR domain-containing protein [Chloracidobacterium sp.]MBP9936626.1 FecR domain-containing protein [Pyrinomonadaceae bacterium]MBK7802700.1 FecR domain-containing protein [Chloracidobacterium sp.]MBK9437555.1 FecR domain-containing protein [Chloracidobacterium sp.]MBL0240221.1 FecR domain-containing protein [Chloracidobacterium sp.]
MMKIAFRVFCVGILTVMSLTVGFSQTDRELATAAAGDKYVISAKAGGVNFVEGAVGIVRKAGRSGLLLKRDEILVGDRVSTGSDGKAEILLNPGSYMRIGPNSSFEFTTVSLDDLRIRLDSGSAIFEVFAADEFRVTVNTPKTKVNLMQTGVYRIDVNVDGGAKVAVWEGQAQLGDSTAGIIKKGRQATVTKGVARIAKFDRGERDPFEQWSRNRAKELAKNVAKLRNRGMRNALMASHMNGGWGLYNSFGLWVYDSMFGSSCFLPFGYGWGSPYGWGFGNSIWYYHIPIWTPPVIVNNTPTVTPIVTAGNRLPTPPFVRLQQNGGGFSGGGRIIQDSGVGSSPDYTGSRGGSSGSTYVPPPPPPPPVNTGARTRPN